MSDNAWGLLAVAVIGFLIGMAVMSVLKDGKPVVQQYVDRDDRVSCWIVVGTGIHCIPSDSVGR